MCVCIFINVGCLSLKKSKKFQIATWLLFKEIGALDGVRVTWVSLEMVQRTVGNFLDIFLSFSFASKLIR